MECKDILLKAFKDDNILSLSSWIEKKGIEFFEHAKKEGSEIVVAKMKEGINYNGKHKLLDNIKVMQDKDLLV